jgi:hypothetical protein
MKRSLFTAIRACIGFAAVIAVLLLSSSVLSYGQDEQSAALSGPPILRRHVMLPASSPSGANQSPMKPTLRVATGPQPQGVNTGIGVVYTCASNVPASTCNYLNTVVAGYYNSVFTNANANIYIKFGTTGLGQSDGLYNLIHYTPYVTALTNETKKSSVQTSALSGINTYATPIYASQNIVEVTAALGSALGFTGMLGLNAAETASCTPYTPGCYNEVVTVADAASQASGGFSLYYDDQGGTEAANQYDYYAVVEHETDEVLGTSSCVHTGTSGLADGCDGPAPAGSNGVPSAVDLNRYDSPGVLAADMSPSTNTGQYFSFDGGAHYGAYGRATSNSQKVYNTLANHEDFADYTSSSPDCGTNEAIQDAEGCPGEDAGLTVFNDGQSELVILNAVGYLTPEAVISSPAPGSTLSGTSATFTWSAVSGATGYAVYVGSTGVGSANVFQGAAITATSQAVTGLPTTGTVYVRVWSYLNGFWTSIDYTFKGGTSAPAITLTPTAVTFPGTTTVGATDATTEVVTVKNTGTASATISGITIIGTNPTSFSKTTTCGASLAASATCTVTLTFKPTVTGTNSATLKVADNAGTGSQTASITGTGATGTGGAVISLSATSLTFANTIDGTSSVAQTITVKNTGTATANLTSIALGGTNPLQFKELKTCGATLAVSASCAVYISLKPTLAEALSAVLSITDNASGSPQTVTLSGTGTAAPPIGLSVTSLAFPATTHATVSLAKSVTITNNGTATVHLISIAITGTNSSSFTQINTCATTLAPAASCTAFVAFAPAAAGTFSANLTLTDNGAASPQSVALSGTGN